jgi:hypothetical protein
MFKCFGVSCKSNRVVSEESTQQQLLPPQSLLEKRIDIYRKIYKFKYKNKNKPTGINYLSKVIKTINGVYLENMLMNAITTKILIEGKSRHFQIGYYFEPFYSTSINEAVDGNISFEAQPELQPLDIQTLERTPTYRPTKLNTQKYNGKQLEPQKLERLYNQQQQQQEKQQQLEPQQQQEKYKLDLDCESLINILIQSFISVGSFHNLVGYIHRDCICKNFLYQINDIDTDGYYTYILDGETYYLKSCRYDVMISNFEKSKEITMGKTELDAEYDTDATADVFEKYIPKEKNDARYMVLY